MYLWWSLRSLYLLAFQVTVIVGDSRTCDVFGAVINSFVGWFITFQPARVSSSHFIHSSCLMDGSFHPFVLLDGWLISSIRLAWWMAHFIHSSCLMAGSFLPFVLLDGWLISSIRLAWWMAQFIHSSCLMDGSFHPFVLLDGWLISSIRLAWWIAHFTHSSCLMAGSFLPFVLLDGWLISSIRLAWWMAHWKNICLPRLSFEWMAKDWIIDSRNYVLMSVAVAHLKVDKDGDNVYLNVEKCVYAVCVHVCVWLGV